MRILQGRLPYSHRIQRIEYTYYNLDLSIGVFFIPIFRLKVGKTYKAVSRQLTTGKDKTYEKHNHRTTKRVRKILH